MPGKALAVSNGVELVDLESWLRLFFSLSLADSPPGELFTGDTS